jgi:hypothetical protein
MEPKLSPINETSAQEIVIPSQKKPSSKKFLLILIFAAVVLVAGSSSLAIHHMTNKNASLPHPSPTQAQQKEALHPHAEIAMFYRAVPTSDERQANPELGKLYVSNFDGTNKRLLIDLYNVLPHDELSGFRGTYLSKTNELFIQQLNAIKAVSIDSGKLRTIVSDMSGSMAFSEDGSTLYLATYPLNQDPVFWQVDLTHPEQKKKITFFPWEPNYNPKSKVYVTVTTKDFTDQIVGRIVTSVTLSILHTDTGVKKDMVIPTDVHPVYLSDKYLYYNEDVFSELSNLKQLDLETEKISPATSIPGLLEASAEKDTTSPDGRYFIYRYHKEKQDNGLAVDAMDVFDSVRGTVKSFDLPYTSYYSSTYEATWAPDSKSVIFSDMLQTYYRYFPETEQLTKSTLLENVIVIPLTSN